MRTLTAIKIAALLISLPTAYANAESHEGEHYMISPDGNLYESVHLSFGYGAWEKSPDKIQSNIMNRILGDITVSGSIQFVDRTFKTPNEVSCRFGKSKLRFENPTQRNNLRLGESSSVRALNFRSSCLGQPGYFVSGILQKKSISRLNNLNSPGMYLGRPSGDSTWNGDYLFLVIYKRDDANQNNKIEIGRINNILLAQDYSLH